MFYGRRERLGYSLHVIAGFVVLHRWPWPLWRIRGAGTLPVGPESFVFHDLAEPQLLWWAHETRRRRWEPEVIHELTEALRPGDVFFDVGAYVGAFTLLASRLVGPNGRVVAFEPDSRARAVLERNVAANGASNVAVVPYAIGDRAGTVRFAASGDSVGHVSSTGEVEVPQVTLDGYCEEHAIRPTVMKVDIEGGEAAALGGSSVAGQVRRLVVEIHAPALERQGVDVSAFLSGLGPHDLLEPSTNGNYAIVVGREPRP